MCRHLTVRVRLALVAGLLLLSPAWAAAVSPPTLEPVRGEACWTVGDGETPLQVEQMARILAEEAAVRSHRVYEQSSSTVNNLQLEEDLIQSTSADELHEVQIERQEQKGNELCVTITARVSPAKLEEVIRQKIRARGVAITAAEPLVSGHSAFGIRVWINRRDGQYVEGERLIVSVQADRDSYIKLDYYQADGIVVHLVPNLYRNTALIKAGQTYTFGGPGDREAFTIRGPFGAEAIKVVASTKPFDGASASRPDSDDSRDYLEILRSELRSLVVKASEAQLAEASATLTTFSRGVAERNAVMRGLRR